MAMSVHNGAAQLPATLDSIFAQTETDFELIVVDDGSTDATPVILAACGDSRLRVITQPNAGLTRALIRACAEATAPVIARHDCGDTSHPDRFLRQLAALTSDGGLVLVSCATAFHAPEGEMLYVATGDGEEVRHSLLADGVDAIRGLTHHGSAMFSRQAYVQAGGYRSQFYFAQDLDLWVRLASVGRVAFVPEVLYHARVDPDAISATYRTKQIETARLILEIRDRPEQAAALLVQAATLRSASRPPDLFARARALHFIASCLRREGDSAWRSYARRALRCNPLQIRTWALFVRRP